MPWCFKSNGEATEEPTEGSTEETTEEPTGEPTEKLTEEGIMLHSSLFKQSTEGTFISCNNFQSTISNLPVKRHYFL